MGKPFFFHMPEIVRMEDLKNILFSKSRKESLLVLNTASMYHTIYILISFSSKWIKTTIVLYLICSYAMFSHKPHRHCALFYCGNFQFRNAKSFSKFGAIFQALQSSKSKAFSVLSTLCTFLKWTREIQLSQIYQECNNCGLAKILRLVIKLLKSATLSWTLKASSLIILLKVDNHRKKWPHFAQWWVSLLFALKGLKSDKVASFSNCWIF